MHSRIFQVSQEPIKEPLTESRYYDYEGTDGIDYIVKSNEKDVDIKWLKQVTKGLEVTEDTIKVVSKKEYFENSFLEFQELIKKYSEYTIEDFVNCHNWIDFYRLKDAYDNKLSFKIDDNDEEYGLTSLDNWVRNVEEGKTYYIGSTFDYHF